jgi:N-methylhydantoinase B
MDELYAYSERMVRAALARLPDGRGEAEDLVEAVDGDLPIHCTVEIAGDGDPDRLHGTAPQYDGNLNCPLAVTKSACYFVVRCLTEPDLPASGGAFAPSPSQRPRAPRQRAARRAVAAGNTETRPASSTSSSPRSAGSCPVPAAGPGDDEQPRARQRPVHVLRDGRRRPGRLPEADGPSAVHVAMSNTLATPVEALELQYPLRSSAGSCARLRRRGGIRAATVSCASCACSRTAGSRC